MKNFGPVSIQTNIEHAELVDVTNKTISHSLNIALAEEKSQLVPSSPGSETKPRKAPSKTKSAIQLKNFKGNKIGFLRVIKALHKEKFFETLDGGRPPKMKCLPPSASQSTGTWTTTPASYRPTERTIPRRLAARYLCSSRRPI